MPASRVLFLGPARSFTVEAFARDLVLALCYAADGQERWWALAGHHKELRPGGLDLAQLAGDRWPLRLPHEGWSGSLRKKRHEP
jgi:hypothetical protein